MKIQSIRTFLPAKSFSVSKNFYKEIGFEVMWENEELCIFGVENQSFFLQDYYVKEWADNCMVQLLVKDLRQTFEVCEKVSSNYEGTKIKEMFESEYGMTFHMIDPSGILWHITSISKSEVDERALLCNE